MINHNLSISLFIGFTLIYPLSQYILKMLAPFFLLKVIIDFDYGLPLYEFNASSQIFKDIFLNQIHLIYFDFLSDLDLIPFNDSR